MRPLDRASIALALSAAAIIWAALALYARAQASSEQDFPGERGPHPTIPEPSAVRPVSRAAHLPAAPSHASGN